MAKKIKPASRVSAPPEGFMPTTDFRDKPFGDGNEMNFRAGIMSSPVPAEFAERMRKEGKAAPNPKPAKVPETAADHG